MSSPEPSPHRFVFQDPHGRRWPRLRRVLALWGLIAALALVWFIWSLLVRPELHLPLSLRQLKGQLRAAIQQQGENAPEDTKVLEPYSLLNSQTIQQRLKNLKPVSARTRAANGEIRLGYYVDWDPGSWQSFVDHVGSLTHVAPEWFSLVGTEGYLAFDPEPRLAGLAASRGVAVMPLLNNLAGNTWQPEAVENLARGPLEKRRAFLTDLTAKLQSARASGLIIDWQQLDPAYTDDYTALITQMSEALHRAGLALWLQVPSGEDFANFDLEELQPVVDRFVLTLSGENSEDETPGPLASQGWVEGWLEVLNQFGDPSQWIGALGAYATDWNTTTKRGEGISFKDAMTRASYAGADQSGKSVTVGARSYNGKYSYSESGGEHQVTFLDAISFSNQLRRVREWKLGGVGVNRLGAEDPYLWKVLDAPAPLAGEALRDLEPLLAGDTITHVGRGEVVSVDDARDDGRRLVLTDAQGLLQAKYVDFPTYPTLYHQGFADPHQVAITFDDGPSPEWTPRILDILRARGVKACFFLIGRNAEDYPGLVERILEEGHEIGNHSYTHQNLGEMTPLRVKLELNMTQRVIESITGHSTILFRPPYNADSNPSRLEELVPLKLAEKELGYLVVLEQVDPRDWARPGADAIVEAVRDQRKDGNIILLHDAGGDRSQTVEALPRILDYLAERGDQVVPLGTLVSVPRDELMPPLPSGSQRVERMVAGTGFRLWRAMIGFFWAFMIFATGIVALRTLLVAWLAHRHYRSRAQAPALPLAVPAAPAVSVIIAAYNEAAVIARTLHSLQTTDFRGPLEILVVDDGSRDHTAAEVERLAAGDSRLRLLRQQNQGKSAALRRGLAAARHDLLVFLDADTQFERGTIRALVEPFANPLVGAVSGNARVGNLRRFIARCQSLEYICGFNLDRRAYTVWNCITVVPGAVSALRRSAIEAAGGFSHDTLAEDTDLTLTLHRLRYRIEFAPEAIAWTEAPETIRTLARQRFRWAFGTMQCLWKHRDLVFNPAFGALGWFSLPNIWFFQIALVAVTPLVDFLLLWSIIFGTATAIWWYFGIFILMELLLSALACHMEGEPMRRAWISVPMRLIYRPLLAWVIWRSILRALQGALVGWGKLERTASVPSRA